MEDKCENAVNVSQIAKIAGVSPTTVLNVLHKRKERMREETFLKVQKVIAETGYVQKIAPNLLSGKGSKIIGAIVYGNEIGQEERKRYADMLFRLEKELYQNEYHVVLHVTDDIEEIVHFSRAWRLQGLFLLGLGKEECLLNKVKKIPIMSYETEKAVKKQIKDFLEIVKDNV